MGQPLMLPSGPKSHSSLNLGSWKTDGLATEEGGPIEGFQGKHRPQLRGKHSQ